MTEQQKAGFYLLSINQLSHLIGKRLLEHAEIDDISDIVAKLEYISNYLYDLEQKI